MKALVVAFVMMAMGATSAGAQPAAPTGATAAWTSSAEQSDVPVGTLDFASCKDQNGGPAAAPPNVGTAAAPPDQGFFHAICNNLEDCEDYGWYMYYWLGIIADYSCTEFKPYWYLYTW